MTETTDIFYAAFLNQKLRLVGIKDTNGHKKLFCFEGKIGKIEYIESEFYKIKIEIDKMKLLGD